MARPGLMLLLGLVSAATKSQELSPRFSASGTIVVKNVYGALSAGSGSRSIVLEPQQETLLCDVETEAEQAEHQAFNSLSAENEEMELRTKIESIARQSGGRVPPDLKADLGRIQHQLERARALEGREQPGSMNVTWAFASHQHQQDPKQGQGPQQQGGEKESFIRSYQGRTVKVVLPHAGSYSLTVTTSGSGSVTTTTTFEVTCRHVRREIMELTPSDRKRFFDAVRIMYKTEGAEGRAAFGNDYRSMDEIWVAHALLGGDGEDHQLLARSTFDGDSVLRNSEAYRRMSYCEVKQGHDFEIMSDESDWDEVKELVLEHADTQAQIAYDSSHASHDHASHDHGHGHDDDPEPNHDHSHDHGDDLQDQNHDHSHDHGKHDDHGQDHGHDHSHNQEDEHAHAHAHEYDYAHGLELGAAIEGAGNTAMATSAASRLGIGPLSHDVARPATNNALQATGHEGLGLSTNYASFVQLLEKAVQTVDAAVSLPFFEGAKSDEARLIPTGSWVEHFELVSDGEEQHLPRIEYPKVKAKSAQDTAEKAQGESGPSKEEEEEQPDAVPFTIEGRFAYIPVLDPAKPVDPAKPQGRQLYKGISVPIMVVEPTSSSSSSSKRRRHEMSHTLPPIVSDHSHDHSAHAHGSIHQHHHGGRAHRHKVSPPLSVMSLES